MSTFRPGRLIVLGLLLALGTGAAHAQYRAAVTTPADAPRAAATPLQGDVSESVFSPFAHLWSAVHPSLAKTAVPFICPAFRYYDVQGSNRTHLENLPSSRWAMRISPPTLAQSICTVWTVTVDFEILGAGFNNNDTMFVFVREVFSPYNTIFQTYFLTRLGPNQGQIEISPTIAPPPNQYAILNPKRDVYVGLQIRGDSAHQVRWNFKTPSVYQSPVRSVRFLPNNTFTDASTVVGTSVDWQFETNLCCNIVWPVEMSVFRGMYDGTDVTLEWRTEAERNNHLFEIQRARSVTGPWESRGIVQGSGTKATATRYEFIDRLGSSVHAATTPELYYRLRQMDFDGAVHDHGPVRVMLTSPEDAGYRLLPAFPNPLIASGSTPATVRYQLPESAPVRITVHDALGREVARLVDTELPAGMHEARWYPLSSAYELRSGQYFIRLQAGGATAVQKLALVR